ncbi:hypothetical protein SUDANB108_00141 [Streptomyces sp. enrichment culture]
MEAGGAASGTRRVGVGISRRRRPMSLILCFRQARRAHGAGSSPGRPRQQQSGCVLVLQRYCRVPATSGRGRGGRPLRNMGLRRRASVERGVHRTDAIQAQVQDHTCCTTVFNLNAVGDLGEDLGGSRHGFNREPGGTLNSMTTGGKSYVCLADEIGSVVAVADETGAKVNGYAYSPRCVERGTATEKAPSATGSPAASRTRPGRTTSRLQLRPQHRSLYLPHRWRRCGQLRYGPNEGRVVVSSRTGPGAVMRDRRPRAARTLKDITEASECCNLRTLQGKDLGYLTAGRFLCSWVQWLSCSS